MPRNDRIASTQAATPAPLFRLGERVRTEAPYCHRGRVVELCGPLGPGGIQIYRVRVAHKPKPFYIELREDQRVAIREKNNPASERNKEVPYEQLEVEN